MHNLIDRMKIERQCAAPRKCRQNVLKACSVKCYMHCMLLGVEELHFGSYSATARSRREPQVLTALKGHF